MKTSFFLYLAFLSVCISSCGENKGSGEFSVFSKDKFDEAQFSEKFKTILQERRADSTSGTLASVSQKLISIYRENDFRPVWIKPDGSTDRAEKFLSDIEHILSDGIDPKRYHTDILKNKLAQFKSDADISVDAALSLDTAFTSGYLHASHDLLFGIISPRIADSLWFHTNDTSWNTDFVSASLKADQYPSLDSFRSIIPLYSLLKKSLQHYDDLASNDSLLKLKNELKTSAAREEIVASIISIEAPWLAPISDTLSGLAASVQAYQQYFGIKRTGKIDSTTLSLLQKDPQEMIAVLQANLERMRWLPRRFGNDYIIVNIPTQNFTMKRNGSNVMMMNVVVGKPSRQTPALNAMMANIVVNPPWGVPPTILKKDVLPGVLKSGGSYLRKKGLEAFDSKGKKVDASVITASNYKRYFFRQPPGHSNALGYVKFNFPNKWDIYMHDTPHREDFGKFNRARSSGCIRLQHPQDLAKYILSDIEGKNFDQTKLDSLIATQKTKWENLTTKIPVHIVYLTAWQDEDESHIRFARDFYRRDAKLMAAISK